jgi:hypothetical protein
MKEAILKVLLENTDIELIYTKIKYEDETYKKF